jgi:RHH-type transcriptional regulator, proline utilization regulon repressor / proline dehydrogenase / delta 1-pyrroline-5-carboxylate dehydrogenase
MTSESGPKLPFAAFRREVQAQTSLRAAITAAYRRPEPQCLPPLIEAATLSEAASAAARETARKLVEALRAKQQHGGVEGLVREYALSSEEGVALMCLAEALLRIPDSATRDALIRDKIGGGDWRSHLGHSPSLFVNAATWGLVVTGKLTGTTSESTLSNALIRLVARGGEPLIRKGVDLAMRMMGEQFVMGQTIGEALARARTMEAKGFRYSYDMLGEAATTAADASRYLAAYETAIHAIGTASQRRGIYEGPGISIKLSALHPRYSRAQRDRVFAELLPRLKMLTLLARRYDVGFNIDAEEADRLDLSLDLLEALCFDPEFEGWNGIGFVVQAYQKRAAFALDFIIDLARRSNHRLMIRLVKGAYWDSEIKRAQVDGLEGFAVFTRKIHTDVSYIACARKLLAAPDAVYPQFATHNALTLATIYAMAGGNYYAGQYEFQCLHGMGEPLYEQVVGRGKLNRPCRIYAPVGTHETLLAYLVRRLLENGANSSFVNRIADPAVAIDDLIADPVAGAAALQPVGAQHERITLPRDLYGAKRENSAGLDLCNEQVLAALAASLWSDAGVVHRATPLIGNEPASGRCRPVFNPADRRDRVGEVEEADPILIDRAFAIAVDNVARWAATPPSQRATLLDRAAALMQARMEGLIGVIVREAGKSLPNAVGEVREAIDFLRYYAAQIRERFSNDTHRPLGPVVCISPWNFPLAIFTGQVAAALAAGNPVLAKPAEETPLIASLAVAILREAGVPSGVIQLLPGDGKVGAALVGDVRARGVMFTGSTEVARLIQAELAKRTNPDGKPVPLIAETGGQNALIVDSSALAEQVVGDVIQSAFDSAGQRCSALRVLCLQEEVADQILTMLKGALREVAIGNPDRLAIDVGPVITAEAKAGILDHVEAMRSSGHVVEQLPLPEACRYGTFVPPTLIEIGSLAELKREVFGPVLHVLRFRRDGLDRLLDDINATGYALTFGLHTRIDETVDQVVSRVGAGNVYLNRNLIGAVVGVQPFGGHGLSGTGPKAGGPLYLYRLLSTRPMAPPVAPAGSAPPGARLWVEYLASTGSKAVSACAAMIDLSPVETVFELSGPVGERNLYMLKPRGAILCVAETVLGLQIQIGAALASGNKAIIDSTSPAMALENPPAGLKQHLAVTTDRAADEFDAVLLEGDEVAVRRISAMLAARPGPIVGVHALSREAVASGSESYALEWLLTERSVSTNTTAAGGNASLMSIS